MSGRDGELGPRAAAAQGGGERDNGVVSLRGGTVRSREDA